MRGYILLGSPGAGKGTLGHFMKSCDIKHIASGDVLRREVYKGTSIGRQTERLIQEGKQVPDALITEIVLRKLERCIEQQKEFALDGFPQTLPQLESLYAFLAQHPECSVTPICIEVEPETAFQRLVGRISCPKCDVTYHNGMFSPTAERECDTCKIPLIKRGGDNPKQAIRRLKRFHDTTEKVMDCVRNDFHVFSIDGNYSMDFVRAQLADILEHETV